MCVSSLVNKFSFGHSFSLHTERESVLRVALFLVALFCVYNFLYAVRDGVFFSLLPFRSYAICMLSCCFWSVVCLAIFIHWYATIIPQTYGERAISPYNSESGGERFYPQFECTGMNVEK